MPTSVEAALLDHHIFADDEAMRRHLSQLGKNARDVLVGIDKGKHNGQVASCLDEMGGLNAASALETRDRVESDGAGNVFRAQILQHFQVQRTVMPGIAFREIHGYLYSHRSCHFTTLARLLRPRRQRPGRARYWPQCSLPSASTVPAPCRRTLRRHSWKMSCRTHRSRWLPAAASEDRAAGVLRQERGRSLDRKSTRLNSSHLGIS